MPIGFTFDSTRKATGARNASCPVAEFSAVDFSGDDFSGDDFAGDEFAGDEFTADDSASAEIALAAAEVVFSRAAAVFSIAALVLSTTAFVLATVADTTGGAVVVLDPNNGDLLALVSAPSYDPNKFIPNISKEDFAVFNVIANLPAQRTVWRKHAHQFVQDRAERV